MSLAEFVWLYPSELEGFLEFTVCKYGFALKSLDLSLKVVGSLLE